MKRPTVASLKKVTPENLAALGADRLARILVAAAQTRPDLKRRLRMELAAEQGVYHLVLEVDRRLSSLATSRSKVSWRKRATFVSDLDSLRLLIVDRLAQLDPATALDRIWLFMDLARPLFARVRDRDGELAAVFLRAAGDSGRLIAGTGDTEALADALLGQPDRWKDWLPALLAAAPPALAASALGAVKSRSSLGAGSAAIVRQLADATGDVQTFQATFSAQALREPAAAAEVAQRLLAAGRIDEAGRLLEATKPTQSRAGGLPTGRGAAVAPDYGWETIWIDYLDQTGRPDEAQEVRWQSFERSLSVERAKAFTRRLTDFDDVEAEGRAFTHAAAHADFERGLAFLMEWPALPEAARMIAARVDDIRLGEELTELWADRLRMRHPKAAQSLLRAAAAAAAHRRNFKAAQRFSGEADAIALAAEKA
jgi:hypothetical protein